MMPTTETAFIDAMRGAGLEPADPGEIHADGELHRFRIAGDKAGSRNGWAILHGDSPAVGLAGSWKSGARVKWAAQNGHPYGPEEKRAYAARMHAMTTQRKAEEQSRRAEAMAEAARRWDAATEPDPAHPYLLSKAVPALGIRQEGNALLVPVRDSKGTLHSLQTITEDGTKRFQTGGALAGHFYEIEGDRGTVYVAEGYATAATIHKATGAAVLVAFNCGNLPAVTVTARKRYPTAAVIVAADNDTRTEGNPGLTKGRAAALAAGARLTYPRFADGENGTDWNDLAALRGLDAVREALADIEKPGADRPQIDVSGDWLSAVRAVADAVKPAGEIFCRAGEVVRLDTQGKECCFEALTAAGACSELERFSRFVKVRQDGRLEPTRLCESTARLLLAAPELARQLPRIEKIADYPMPCWQGKRLTLTAPGYAPETRIYTRPGIALDVPPLSEALPILTDLLSGFCFAKLDSDDGAHYGLNALAYLLTCHCRLLYEPERAPVFYASGNRPGVGKDYLLGLGPLLVTGKTPQFYPPTENADETRKRILALCRSGARFMIVSNCRGHLADEALEQAATSAQHSDRILGRSEELTLPNLAIYAISGNQLSFTEDMNRRMVHIELTYYGESLEERRFPHTDLYAYATENRPKILGALQAMVNRWGERGTPQGKAGKASFVKWAQVIGGILEACDLPNPIGRNALAAAPTQENEHFAAMLAEIENRHGTSQVGKEELQSIASDLDLFGWLGDLENDRSAKTRFGLVLKKMERRRFGGLALLADRTTTRPRWQVTREG